MCTLFLSEVIDRFCLSFRASNPGNVQLLSSVGEVLNLARVGNLVEKARLFAFRGWVEAVLPREVVYRTA